MEYKKLSAEYDKLLAKLIRYNLKAHHLDIPGTVYFDKGLDNLSAYYKEKGRAYYLLLDNGYLAGGIGLAEFNDFENTCELQKLYLDDKYKGNGLGYKLISLIEEKAKGLGYKHIYLETHTNLKAAIHIYEKCGYKEIKRPMFVVHGTMNKFYFKDLL